MQRGNLKQIRPGVWRYRLPSHKTPAGVWTYHSKTFAAARQTDAIKEATRLARQWDEADTRAVQTRLTVAGLVDDPCAHVDASTPVDASDLADSVGAAMADPDDPERHSRAVEAFADWLMNRVPAPNEEGLLANAMSDLLMSDPTVLRLDDAAQRLAVFCGLERVRQIGRVVVGVQGTEVRDVRPRRRERQVGG